MDAAVVDLVDLEPDDEPRFGGKACGLARLQRAGVSVPAGFAVRATREALLAWPEADRQELQRGVAALLAGGRVAVRSSAVGEDSARRSYAGLLETGLGVATLDDAIAAVDRCVASGASARVLAYGGGEALAVGVVVQRQVEARCAGVCFTRDPTGRDGGLVVEAVAGVGEPLVTGRADPERWRAYRTGLGTWDCRVEGVPKVLGPTVLALVASEAAELERRLGEPLDLEWALDGEGRLWWLQARPITSMIPPPRYRVQRSVDGVDDGAVTVWSNWNVRETMPEPLDPLTWSVWRDDLLPTVTCHLFGARPGSDLARQLLGLDLVQGRVYFNMNAFLASPGIGALASPLLRMMDAATADAVSGLRREGVLAPRRLPGTRLGRAARAALASLRGAARLAVALRPRRCLAVLEQDALAVARRPPVAGLADADLLAELRLWSQPPCRRLLYGLQMEAVAAVVYGLARHAFRHHPEAVHLLARGIPANPTTQISLAVEELVTAARSVEPLVASPLETAELLDRLEGEPAAAPFLASLASFMDRFGHRGPMEFDLGAQRWADDPTMIVELVRSGLRQSSGAPLAERMATMREDRRRAVSAAASASAPWRRPALRAMARLVELYMPLREAPKHHGLLVFDRMRRSALELGRRLVERGLLADPGDVFLLDLEELEAVVGDGADPAAILELVARRRSELATFGREPAPDLVRSDGVPVAEPDRLPSLSGVLRGVAASPGRSTGPVCRLERPDPRRVAAGDVLVVRFADPGWTPLFPAAAGVVMEVGGMMCHAAVVARELGVPAVFGVAGATTLLVDGERVTVDGTAGTVTRG